MPLTLHWYLPTHGDSRDVVGAGPDARRRPPSLGYLAQLARAAEELGFAAVLTPTSTWCEDAWIVTAALLSATSRLKFLEGVIPILRRRGLIAPLPAAGGEADDHPGHLTTPGASPPSCASRRIAPRLRDDLDQ